MHVSIVRGAMAVAAAAALSALGATGADASGSATRATAGAPAMGTSHAVACPPGTRLWLKRYNGPANGRDYAESMAVSPTGDRVFVTGWSYTNEYDTKYDYATVAYNAVTGSQLWVKRYNDSAGEDDVVRSMTVSPAGDRVFVTGDPATIAYNAATGSQLWVQRYNGPGNGDDGGTSVAVSPHGGTVYVTGSSTGTTSGADYATIAYSG